MMLEELFKLGFDKSYRDDKDNTLIHVRCSQCEAICISDIPTHEIGCPNQNNSNNNNNDDDNYSDEELFNNNDIDDCDDEY
jgi:hypothetical protein